MLEADRPGEGTDFGLITAFKEGDTYRLYYRGTDLGLFEFNGSRKNNIVFTPPVGLDDGWIIDAQ